MEIKFKSGRVLDPNKGYVGINQNLELSEGYDREILIPEPNEHTTQFSKEDWLELADEMMHRWRAFALKVREKE